jgi:IS5 family transposase
VAVDEKHTLIRQTTLTAANVHDSREFETVVRGDEEMVVADKAYWSQARSQWCRERGIANGILRKPSRGEKLREATLRGQPAVERDALWHRESVWLVEAVRGVSAGAVCGTGTQPAGTGV